jgi:hypothetical protein
MVDFNPENYEANPLKKYFRQAKVYVTLPSKGNFYPAGALDMPENGELPIYPMTAKDELTMKTPDALLNGQATVSLIQSCVPNIKDAWKMPSVDLDALLIAIRIATYGETMEIQVKVPNTGEERKFDVDLRQLLNKLVSVEYDTALKVNDMTVNLRPLNYKEFTEAALKTFEEQRIFALVNDDTVPEEEKLARFNESFSKLTNLTVDTMSKSIQSITIGDTTVDNQAHIDEFIQNADKEFYNYIVEHLDAQKEKFQIEPIKVDSLQEDIDKGAPKTWTVPITFDQSNFFA